MTEGLSAEERATYARYIASHRQKVAGTCEYCHAPFTGYVKKRFCNGRHRALFYYHEKRKVEPGEILEREKDG